MRIFGSYTATIVTGKGIFNIPANRFVTMDLPGVERIQSEKHMDKLIEALEASTKDLIDEIRDAMATGGTRS